MFVGWAGEGETNKNQSFPHTRTDERGSAGERDERKEGSPAAQKGKPSRSDSRSTSA